jgi:hypothetical protein
MQTVLAGDGKRNKIFVLLINKSPSDIVVTPQQFVQQNKTNRIMQKDYTIKRFMISQNQQRLWYFNAPCNGRTSSICFLVRPTHDFNESGLFINRNEPRKTYYNIKIIGGSSSLQEGTFNLNDVTMLNKAFVSELNELQKNPSTKGKNEIATLQAIFSKNLIELHNEPFNQ